MIDSQYLLVQELSMQTRKNALESVRSVKRAIDIVVALGDGVCSPKRIGDRLNLSKSTVHRLLHVLEGLDMAAFDPVSRNYCTGPLIARLNSDPLIAHQNLISAAMDEMYSLRDSTGETVGLQIRLGSKRIFLEEIQSRFEIRNIVGKGHMAPILTGSAGRMLLAEMKDAELIKLLKYVYTTSPKLNTIGDKGTILKEIEKVRVQGYATFPEHLPAGAAMSVPVKNYHCPVALTVFGPASRFHKPIAVLPELKAVANRISKKLL
jgi:DNA-binding IclR family transcriptional regulator